MGSGSDFRGDRSGSEAVGERPSGGAVHPAGAETPGKLAAGERPSTEKFDRDQLLLETRLGPKGANECPCFPKGPRAETERTGRDDPAELGDSDPEDGHGRTEIRPKRRIVPARTESSKLSGDAAALGTHPRR